MRVRKAPLSFATAGMFAALAVMGCSSPREGTAGTGGAGSGGTGTGGAPSSSGSGGSPTTSGTGGATSDPGTGGTPQDPGTGGTIASGTGGVSAGGTGGSGSDASVKGGQNGSVDAGATTDAPVSTGPGCTGFLFCDDFESQTNGAAPAGKWTTQARGSGKAVIDTTMAYSGKQSVHFTGTVSQSSANIIAKSAPEFPIQGDVIFIRMMMYIKTYPATSGTHTRFMRIGINTGGADGSAYALETYNGVGIEHVNSGMFRDTTIHLGDSIVTGKWVCWEWSLDNKAGPPKGDTGTVMGYIWRDGTALPLAVTNDKNPWNPIPWNLLEVGLEAYQNDTVPGDFWVDDVAISNKKIGCPTK